MLQLGPTPGVLVAEKHHQTSRDRVMACVFHTGASYLPVRVCCAQVVRR